MQGELATIELLEKEMRRLHPEIHMMRQSVPLNSLSIDTATSAVRFLVGSDTIETDVGQDVWISTDTASESLDLTTPQKTFLFIGYGINSPR